MPVQNAFQSYPVVWNILTRSVSGSVCIDKFKLGYKPFLNKWHAD